MILLSVHDPILRASVRRCAQPDEAVVTEAYWVQEARANGYARVHVRDDCPVRVAPPCPGRVPELHVSPEMLRAWEHDRRKSDVPPDRVDAMARPLARAIQEVALESTWVDRLLAHLSRSVGAPLPLSFRAFTRRTLELPCRYTDLSAISEAAGVSRGALKARFRRQELESPFTYLRWLRAFAVAELLVDPDITVAAAARALGFTSDTNMCRMVKTLTGATPGGLRERGARRRLHAVFVSRHLGSEALVGWSRLDALFRAGRAA